MSSDVSPPEARQRISDRHRTLIAAGIALVALGIALWWGFSRPLEGSPLSDDAPTSVATVPTVAPGAPGEVTAAAGLPAAQPLTDDVLADVDTLWTLATFHGNVPDAQGGNALAGPTVLYLVSPSGDAFQVANLTAIGADRLVAWDSARNMALLGFEQGVAVRSYDLDSRAVGPAIDPCDGATPTGPGAAFAHKGNWRLYTECFRAESGADGGPSTFIHAVTVGDRGELANNRGVVSPAQGSTVTLAHGAQIVSGLHVGYDEDGAFLEDEYHTELTAHLADGGTVALPLPDGYQFCDVVGPGRGTTVAAFCTAGAEGSLWELPLNGDAPLEAIGTTRLPVNAEGELLRVAASCAADSILAVQFAGDDPGESTLLVLDRLVLRPVAIDQLPATACLGALGSTFVIGGPEGLAYASFDTGEVAVVLRAPTPGQLGLNPDQWVRGVTDGTPVSPAGAEDQGVAIAP